MRNNRLALIAVACCAVVASINSASAARFDCAPLEWHGDIYAENRDYIKVEVDARNMQSLQYLQDVSFSFMFYDQRNNPIARDVLKVTNEPKEGMYPAFYEIYLRHYRGSASYSKGESMTFTCKAKGLTYKETSPPMPSSVPSRDSGWETSSDTRRPTIIGSPRRTSSNTVQSASDYAGRWQNTDGTLGYIQFLEIVVVDPNRLRVHAWLRCGPPPAKGGTIRDCVDWGTDEVEITNVDKIIWVHNETQEREVRPDVKRQSTVVFTHTLTLTGDTLNVQVDKFGNGYNLFKRVTRR